MPINNNTDKLKQMLLNVMEDEKINERIISLIYVTILANKHVPVSVITRNLKQIYEVYKSNNKRFTKLSPRSRHIIYNTIELEIIKTLGLNSHSEMLREYTITLVKTILHLPDDIINTYYTLNYEKGLYLSVQLG